MASAKRHNELVDFLMSETDLEGEAYQQYVLENFGDFTFPEIDKAMRDAADRKKEESAELNAQADELERFMPLFNDFDGDRSTPLVDVARKKHAEGNPLAAEFLRYAGVDEKDW